MDKKYISNGIFLEQTSSLNIKYRVIFLGFCPTNSDRDSVSSQNSITFYPFFIYPSLIYT